MDTIKKTCSVCECDFDGVYDGSNVCDECQEKIDKFYTYKFGVNTEVGIYANDIYYKVLSVDFEKREIETILGIFELKNIKEIRN